MVRRKLLISCVTAPLVAGVCCFVAIVQSIEGRHESIVLLQGVATASIWIASVSIAVLLEQHVGKPSDHLYGRLRRLVRHAMDRESIAETQRKLDDNLSCLRDLVYGHGDPHLVGGHLYFGNLRIGGDDTIVDQVQAQFGGAATIFCGDTRVSTTVADLQGRRVTGTRLEASACNEAVFTAATSYRGEVEVFGEAYVAIYEPIIAGRAVIGALFVAVKTQDILQARSEQAIYTVGGKEEPDQLAAQVAVLETTLLHRYDAMQETNALRSDLLDARRKQRAIEREHAAAQLNETRSLLDNSRTLAKAVDELAKRTEHQAATLEETTAAIDFITAAVRQTARSVATATAIASAARIEADRSGTVVQDAITAMGHIQTSSSEIEQIVSLIDEIATKTNLLALNATIEAARAGDAGRGFAVVALEVRALAKRSATAARAITALISTASDHVRTGVGLVDKTGKAIELIAGKIYDLDQITESISLSATEQATSLQEINVAMGDLDRVTQENAAMVEGSMTATQHLADQSARLERLAGGVRGMGQALAAGPVSGQSPDGADYPVTSANRLISAAAA